MKVIYSMIILFLTTVFVYSKEQAQDIFLMNYFNHVSFETTSYSFDGLDFVFAYNEVDVNGVKAFTRAIAFKASNTTIEPLLYLDKETCYTPAGELFRCYIVGDTFLGWEFIFSERRGTIHTIFHSYQFDSKRASPYRMNVTDGPTIEWNQYTNQFQEFTVDYSDY